MNAYLRQIYGDAAPLLLRVGTREGITCQVHPDREGVAFSIRDDRLTPQDASLLKAVVKKVDSPDFIAAMFVASRALADHLSICCPTLAAWMNHAAKGCDCPLENYRQNGAVCGVEEPVKHRPVLIYHDKQQQLLVAAWEMVEETATSCFWVQERGVPLNKMIDRAAGKLFHDMPTALRGALAVCEM